MICGDGAGKDGSAVFCTLVLGANACGVTEVQGGGLQHIVKQLGYGGDPLNQRSSCGWKATKAAKRLVVEAYAADRIREPLFRDRKIKLIV